MNKPSKQVYLIRHGETAWSLSGQHTGVTDIPLTENGRKMAERFLPLATKLNYSLVMTSPLERAKTTCTLAGFGTHAQVDHDLMEWNYGAYEGKTTKQIHETTPDWELFKDGCPGGESPIQVSARVDRLLAKLHATEGNAVLFAHGHILRALAVRWIELPVSNGCHFMLDTATMSILSDYRGVPTIKQWNAPL